MVELQRLTGMRSGEMTVMRPCDVDRSSSVWVYKCIEHKSRRKQKPRAVAIGPKAQKILGRYLPRKDDAYFFSPAEAVAAQNEAKRKRPQDRRRLKKVPIRKPGERYTTRTYRKPIERAIAIINAERIEKKKPQIEGWFPHQLRHERGTAVRKEFGLEGAQVYLGHAKANVTEIYAKRDLDLAITIAARIG